MGRHSVMADRPAYFAAHPTLKQPPERRRRSLGSLAGRGAMWAVAASLTMRFASVAVTALLARLLSKEDFGVFAIALAVYLVVSSLAELGMASAVARSAVEPDDIAPTVASISILASGVVGIGMAACAPLLASALGQPAAAEPIRVLSLCLVLTGIFAVPGAQLVREFRQDRIFLGTIVGFLVSNPILIVLAVNGGGATAFAWSRVVGQLATGLVFVLSTSRRYRPGWRQAAVGPLIRFGLPLSLANLVNWTLLNADYLILGRLVDAAQVGVYLIAFNVASWSTAVMGSVLNSVVVPAFGRVSDDRARLGQALLAASELVALAALPFGALTLALSDPLITALFGSRWNEASPVLAVLSVYGVLYAFSLLLVNVLVATGRTVRLLLIQLGWVAVLVPAILFGIRLSGLQGVAWAHVLTIGAVAVPAYAVAVVRVTGQSVRQLLRVWVRPVCAAAVAGVGALLTAQVFSQEWLSLVAGGIVGILLYLAGVGPILVRRLPRRFVPRWLPSRWGQVFLPEGA
jgi:PST family polysaccharide transporter